MDGRAIAGRPVDLGVVRQAGDRGDDHRQDAEEHRDVGDERLADDVGDERDGQRADRDVRDDGMDRVAEPRPIQEVLDGPDRMEERAEPAVVEVAERLRPTGLGVHGTGQVAS